MTDKIHGVLTVEVCDCDPATGKPYLKIRTLDGTELSITTNAAEMLGGAATGVRKRYEDGGFETKN